MAQYPTVPRRLGLVTENPHKVEEWQAICAIFAPWLTVVPVAPLSAVVEDEPTFAGNARLKALAGLQAFTPDDGFDALVGEDTGVIIPALSGTDDLAEFPGLWSNRWFTPEWATRLNIDGVSSADRNQAILQLMAGKTDRRAVYRCVLVGFLINSPSDQFVSTGEWQLTVGQQAQGTGGFGYDPIMMFLDASGLVTQTVASLPAAVKNTHSHRALAIAHLLPQLFPYEKN